MDRSGCEQQRDGTRFGSDQGQIIRLSKSIRTQVHFGGLRSGTGGTRPAWDRSGWDQERMEQGSGRIKSIIRLVWSRDRVGSVDRKGRFPISVHRSETKSGFRNRVEKSKEPFSIEQSDPHCHPVEKLDFSSGSAEDRNCQ